MQTFVIGDIHGAYRALLQCLERAQFDDREDRLIALGDVCDGYPEVKECIDELLRIKHCDYIIGNHDLWALDWAIQGIQEDVWLTQGGYNTIISYGGKTMPQPHVDLLKNAHHWLEIENKIFVHGGFDPRVPLPAQSLETLVWDRALIQDAWQRSLREGRERFSRYEEVYLGHTPTQKFGSSKPLKLCNVWAMDTGAGWSGVLTIMDVATKKYWQSDPTPTLYPGARGRG